MSSDQGSCSIDDIEIECGEIILDYGYEDQGDIVGEDYGFEDKGDSANEDESNKLKSSHRRKRETKNNAVIR